jgi:hypothetical protein
MVSLQMRSVSMVAAVFVRVRRVRRPTTKKLSAGAFLEAEGDDGRCFLRPWRWRGSSSESLRRRGEGLRAAARARSLARRSAVQDAVVAFVQASCSPPPSPAFPGLPLQFYTLSVTHTFASLTAP